jgi:hypothetical protein
MGAVSVDAVEPKPYEGLILPVSASALRLAV